MNVNDENKRPEEIESELEQTRAQVSSTIDAIQSKLTPGQLMDQAVDYWRRSAPADFGSNLSNSVRQNPLPVTLIGLGIAWLMMAGRKSETRARPSRFDEEYDYNEDYETSAYGYDIGAHDYNDESRLQRARSAAGETADHLKDKAAELSEHTSEAMHGLRDKASDMAGRAGERIQGLKGRTADMGDRTRGMARSARDRFAGTASSAKERVGELQDRSREQYYRARSGVSNLAEEQPLVIGAIGVAIGAALGATLPATRREDEWMGQRRDELLEGAKDTARQYVEPMKDSAQRVAQTAEQELQRASSASADNPEQVNEPASSDIAGTETFTGGNSQVRPGSTF